MKELKGCRCVSQATVSCAVTDLLPDVVFNINGYSFALPPSAYVIKVCFKHFYGILKELIVVTSYGFINVYTLCINECSTQATVSFVASAVF